MEAVVQTESEGATVGDTKGAALLVENVAISRGSNTILSNVNLRIERSQRWGIVGPNGNGKSTLLGAIVGTVRMDEGSALVAPKLNIGHLKQTAVAGSTKTVFEEAASEMTAINDVKEEIRKLEVQIADGDITDSTLNKLSEATEAFTNAGGWTQEQDVDSVLKGLGFAPDDSKRLCSDFSGGWQMRIALARLLLSKPSILLLDEPSNHLDSSARDWLGKYLASFEESLILVSHDITLIQASVNNIADINGGTLLTYQGCTYDKFLEEKEFRAQSAMAEYERNVAEAARLQAFVDKWGASATKATAAQSRVKMIEKMRKEGKLTPPPAGVTTKQWSPSLVLPPPPKAMGDTLMAIKGGDFGYESTIVSDANLEIKRGMKLILRGPNGAGKSTLMAVLRGDLELRKGTRVENESLKLGSFTQDLAQQLDVHARAVDLVTAYARGGRDGDINVSDEDARGVMGRIGLSGDKPLRKIGQLSGGEKARVALSMFALKASNVLMLDEPSNHLDVECIDALSKALSSWGGKDGAVIVVSHDKAFCDDVGFTHVGTVDDGTLTVEERGLTGKDWVKYDIHSAIVDGSSNGNKLFTKEEEEELENRRKAAYNAPKRIKKLEQMIEDCEAKIAEIEEEMVQSGTDVGKLVDLNNEKEIEEAKVADMMDEWSNLEMVLEELN